MDRTSLFRLLGVTALAVVVALGAAGDSTWGPMRVGRPSGNTLLALLVVAMILGGAGAWFAEVLRLRRSAATGGPASEAPDDARRASSSGDTPRRVSPRRVFPRAVAAFAVLGLLGITLVNVGLKPLPPGEGSEDSGRPPLPFSIFDSRSPAVRTTEQAEEDPAAPTIEDQELPVGAVFLLLLVAGAALAWWWRGRQAVDADADALEGIDAEAARSSVLRSIEAMLADPDPNTAVIGAYARLLEGLAASGVPRWDFEAPVEHLRRALTRLQVRPGPIHRLVALFEVARFSTRSLTVQHRDEALAALREVADDLGYRSDGAPRTTASGAGAVAGVRAARR